MTCREFEKIWTTRAPADLPAAAREHRADCPGCSALARMDAATDAALHRMGATPPEPDIEAARAAIRRALSERPGVEGRRTGRWPLAIVGAGLAAAAALALLLALPALHPSERTLVQRLPHHGLSEPEPGVNTPLPTQPGSSSSRRMRPAPDRRERLFSPLQLRPAPSRPEGVPFRTPAPRPSHHAERALRLVAAPGGGSPSTRLREFPSPRPPQGPAGVRITASSPLSPPGLREEGFRSGNLRFLNEGRLTGARPYFLSPAPALPPLPPPLVQERKPGSLVVDDLLSLNPIQVAAADDSGLGAAARIIAAESPETDPRLQQKVWVQVTNRRIEDLLAWLTRATGVTLVPRMEIADERVTLWTDGQPLMDVMRELRHLHGYYWSRSKRERQYVYSLWQDAQSRAREEAEIERLALDAQRQFQESVWKHVRALHADEAELRRLAKEDPYLVAQMLHPVVRAGYQLFAALSPDQQAQLLQGQTPSRALPSGMPLRVMPLQTFTAPAAAHPGQTVTGFAPPEMEAVTAPLGDVVTFGWAEMSSTQRAAVEAMFHGAQAQEERESRRQPPSRFGNPYDGRIRAVKMAELESATVSLIRWGEPGQEGLSLRVEFQSEGRLWGLSGNLAGSTDADAFYKDLIRKGGFRLWAGAEEDLRPYRAAIQEGAENASQASDSSPPSDGRDPILDAPVTVSWVLPIRGGRPALLTGELLAALHREIHHPLVLDTGYAGLQLPYRAAAEFHWQNRPLRALLHRLFPGWECAFSGGAIFLRDPDRLKGRLHQVPAAVERLLDELRQQKQPYTLDDMALLARTLSSWQIVKLTRYLPPAAIDQTLAAQELLKLYGELAPAQRAALADGVPFASLTPPQQALFVEFAQRQRPFVEPWRFQHGGLRLVQQPAPPASPFGSLQSSASRVVFQVQLQENDSLSFPIDLVNQREDFAWTAPPSQWVGKAFPFSTPSVAPEMDAQINPGWKPALADPRLRGRAEVILISRPFADPFIGVEPPSSPTALARNLAARLHEIGVPVVQLTLSSAEDASGHRAQKSAAPLPANLIGLQEPGDTNGQPFDSVGSGARIESSPTLFVVDGGEQVRAVFEGQQACDMQAVERAARECVPAAAGKPAAARP